MAAQVMAARMTVTSSSARSNERAFHERGADRTQMYPPLGREP